MKLDILDRAGEPVAFTVVQNLEQVLDQQGGLEGYYPVIHLNSKATVANLRVNLRIEQVRDPKEKPEPERASKPKVTLKSKPRSSQVTMEQELSRNQRVTFSDRTLGPTSTSRTQGGPASPARTPLADSLVSELLNHSQQLRESMRRKIEINFSSGSEQDSTGRKALTREQQVTTSYDRNEDFSDSESLHTIDYRDEDAVLPRASKENVKSRSRDNVPPARNLPNEPTILRSRDNISTRPKEPVRSGSRDLVPSWNLPVDRMKQLAKVSRLTLHIFTVQLNSTVMDKLLKKDNKKLPTKPREKEPVSFFVRYKFPAEGDETSLCSRKLKGNFVDFNEKKSYEINFTSQTLEEWWNYRMEMKVFSRHLNQRQPLLLGEATLGLKHLLIQDRFSSGETLSLPLYSSTSLFRDLKLPADTTEIIGNVHLSLMFSCVGVAVGSRIVENKNAGEQPSSRAAEPSRDGRRTVTINSKTEKENVFSEAILLRLRVSMDGPEELTVKHRNLEGSVSQGEVGNGKELEVTSCLFLPGKQGNLHNR